MTGETTDKIPDKSAHMDGRTCIRRPRRSVKEQELLKTTKERRLWKDMKHMAHKERETRS